MANILVTGATGFIGAHLVEALVRRGDRVRCLVRASSPRHVLAGLDVEFVEGSLGENGDLRSAVADTDVVFHVAGLISSLRSSELFHVNRDGTDRLARACAAQAVPPVLVVISSLAAAGPATRHACRSEDDPAAPVSWYGASKRAGELAAQRYSGVVPTTIVRPGIVFGPRDREALPVFQSVATFRLHLVPTFASPPLSLIYVDDLVDLLLRAAASGQRLPGCGTAPRGRGIYFACHHEHPDYEEWGHQVAAALGVGRILALTFAEPMPWLIAGATELFNRCRGKCYPLNIDKMRDAIVESWVCSGERASRELNFSVSDTLAAQLRHTAEWYREHGWLAFGHTPSPHPVRAQCLCPRRRGVA